MPRRARTSKLRTPEASSVRTLPPWDEMDPAEEAEARESYLLAYEFASRTPCLLGGEGVMAARDRCGGKPKPIWDAIRFDPDDELRRESLIQALRQLACGAWDAIDSAERCGELGDPGHQRRPKPRAGIPLGHLADNAYSSRIRGLGSQFLGVAAWQINTGRPGPPEAVQEAREDLAERARAHIARLNDHLDQLTDPALAGLRVTDTEITDDA